MKIKIFPPEVPKSLAEPQSCAFSTNFALHHGAKKHNFTCDKCFCHLKELNLKPNAKKHQPYGLSRNFDESAKSSMSLAACELKHEAPCDVHSSTAPIGPLLANNIFACTKNETSKVDNFGLNCGCSCHTFWNERNCNSQTVLPLHGRGARAFHGFKSAGHAGNKNFLTVPSPDISPNPSPTDECGAGNIWKFSAPLSSNFLSPVSGFSTPNLNSPVADADGAHPPGSLCLSGRSNGFRGVRSHSFAVAQKSLSFAATPCSPASLGRLSSSFSSYNLAARNQWKSYASSTPRSLSASQSQFFSVIFSTRRQNFLFPSLPMSKQSPNPLLRMNARERRGSRRDSCVPAIGTPWISVTPWENHYGSNSALCRYRNSSLGHSCPNLDLCPVKSTNSAYSHPAHGTGSSHVAKLRKEAGIVHRRNSNRSSRHSYNPNNTSPNLVRCKSPASSRFSGDVPHVSPCPPLSCSPIPSFKPKIHAFENRRWSLASLPSSGYCTPGSSALSFQSQYSSQERLHAYGGLNSFCHPNASASAHVGGTRDSSSSYQHFGSNDSSQGPFLDEGQQPTGAIRTRSRSFNSLAWLNLNTRHNMNSLSKGLVDSGEVTLRNVAYKERFPKAKSQMEEKLRKFIHDNQLNLGSNCSFNSENSDREFPDDQNQLKILSDGSARFLHNQMLELAADVLQKSVDDLLSSVYFYDMFQNLEDLLAEAKEKSPDSLVCLSDLSRRLLLIVSRTARLLECLEFDPDKFYRFLEEAEGQAKEVVGFGKDIPQYIINQLGLSKDPIASFSENLQSAQNVQVDFEPRPDAQLLLTGGTATAQPSHQRPPREKDFESVKLISNGAYGAVYLVRHVQTRRKFALKKLKKLNLALRNQIDQVYAERDILTFSDNPFVVSFYGSFETKRHLCMVMEYVEGGDCAALLKNIGVFPLELARLYIAETVLAIEYLHSYGIVHRDLKPDNLLITALGHIKLTDFGLSKIGLMNRTNLLYEGCLDLSDTQQFQDRQICGTPEYIAPEVILMNGYGKPVDWWALGCILYEFLVGIVPFFGDTPEDLFSHVISDEVQWPEEPDALAEDPKDLIDHLLQQNPIDRLGTLNGAIEIKSHQFFYCLNWNSMLRQKAEFVPQLEGEEDTSYFDTRSDRYSHDVESDDDESGSVTASLDESAAFASFSSCSPRFNVLNEPKFGPLLSDHAPSSVDSGNGSGPSTADTFLAAAPSFYEGVVLRRHSNASPSRLAMASLSTARLTSAAATNSTPPTSAVSSGNTAVGEMQAAAHRRAHTISLPRLSVSIDVEGEHSHVTKELSPVDEQPVYNTVTSPIRPRSALDAPISSKDGASIVGLKPVNSMHQASCAKSTFSTSVDQHVLNIGCHSMASSHVVPGVSSVGQQMTVPLLASHHVSRQLSVPGLPGKQTTIPESSVTAKSPPTHGLHLVIPGDSAYSHSPSNLASSGHRHFSGAIQSPGGSSTSSRDDSPNRKKSSSTDCLLFPMIKQQRAPMTLKRAQHGYGFTFKTIRVYLGQSDYYTIQHIITVIDNETPAFEAGLQPNDLITHVNNTPVQNLTHPQVVQMMLSAGETLNLRVSPLDQTSIQQAAGHRLSVGKLARRKGYKQKLQRKALEKKNRRSSLFRRMSGKRASAELSTLGGFGGGGPSAFHGSPYPQPAVAAHQAAMQRSASTCEALTTSPLLLLAGQHNTGMSTPGPKHSAGTPSLQHTPPPNILRAIGLSPRLAASGNDSSSSSSPVSSVPHSPAGLVHLFLQPIYPHLSVLRHFAMSAMQSRPASLHGLKHKLARSLKSPTRRKTSQVIPLSPLARSEPAYFSGNKDSSTEASNVQMWGGQQVASHASSQPVPIANLSQWSSLDKSCTLSPYTNPCGSADAPPSTSHGSGVSTSPSRSPSPLAVGGPLGQPKRTWSTSSSSGTQATATLTEKSLGTVFCPLRMPSAGPKPPSKVRMNPQPQPLKIHPQLSTLGADKPTTGRLATGDAPLP